MPRTRPEYPVRRPLKRPAMHPGVLMREILEDQLKLTISEAARPNSISTCRLVTTGGGAATPERDRVRTSPNCHIQMVSNAMLFVDFLTLVDSLQKQAFKLLNVEPALVAVTTHRRNLAADLLQIVKW